MTRDEMAPVCIAAMEWFRFRELYEKNHNKRTGEIADEKMQKLLSELRILCQKYDDVEHYGGIE